MKNILTENKLVKNLRAYPVLHKRWCDYIQGVRELPEGFTAEQLFHDYLKVRRSNPEKRVSMSETWRRPCSCARTTAPPSRTSRAR